MLRKAIADDVSNKVNANTTKVNIAYVPSLRATTINQWERAGFRTEKASQHKACLYLFS